MSRSQDSNGHGLFGGLARQGLAAGLAVLVLALSSGRVDVEGAPPSSEQRPTMNVTFRDLDGDRLRSDGNSLYAHGADGTITIDLAPYWTFRMVLDGTRRFHAWLPPPFGGDPNVPPNFSSDGWLIAIEDFGTVPPGGSEPRRAVFNVDGEGGNRFPGSRRPFKRYRWCESCVGYSADLVQVTRTVNEDTGLPRWTVIPQIDGGQFFERPDAFLQETNKNKYDYKGHHPMPFGLTIDCVTNCNALPE